MCLPGRVPPDFLPQQPSATHQDPPHCEPRGPSDSSAHPHGAAPHCSSHRSRGVRRLWDSSERSGDRGWVEVIAGWWYTYPSEKSWSSSVGMMTFPIYGKKCSKPPIRLGTRIVFFHLFLPTMNVVWYTATHHKCIDWTSERTSSHQQYQTADVTNSSYPLVN